MPATYHRFANETVARSEEFVEKTVPIGAVDISPKAS